MGISLFILDLDCKIPAGNIPSAYQALKTVPAGTWVSAQKIEQAQTLEEMLGAWRWDSGPDEEEEGDLELYSFLGEKLGDEDRLFAALGPYVRSGSFVTALIQDGRGGHVWRWFFDGLRTIRQEGRLEFE